MNLRVLLVALIALSTMGFVIGTTIERNSEDGHDEAGETLSEESAEGGEAHSEEEEIGESEEAPGEEAESGHEENEEEWKPLGVDIEDAPFVALAAIFSVALAAGAWVRPRCVTLLAVIALVMVAFAALDVREVFHQQDEDETGLAVLASVIAALHLGAAAVAASMGRTANAAGDGATMAG